MDLLKTSLTTDFLLFCCSLFCFSFYIHVRNIYGYWARRGVPYVKPIFPFGALTRVVFQKTSYAETMTEAYKQMNRSKFIGFYSFCSPGIVLKDLDLIKHIMVKDFNYFTDRGVYANKQINPLSAHLITSVGEEWRLLRSKINSSFTISKLKIMFSVMKKCGEQLKDFVARESAKTEALEWKDVFGRYGFEAIAITAFGLETDSFEKRSSRFFDFIRKIMEPSFIQWLRISLTFYDRKIARLLNISVFPKDVTAFYMSAVSDTVRYRRTNNVFRNDLLQLLMSLKGNETLQSVDGKSKKTPKDPDTGLTMSEIAAHAFIFFWSGFESPSSVMSFCVYELAMNLDIQRKLHEEIDGLEGELTYESLNGMEYLDMVINETLRKYPPLGVSKRICTQDYQLPDSELVIEKGTIVVIPTLAIQMNPELFHEPEKFIPERFSKDNRKNIKPFSFLSFGEGPRMCIGMKYGLMLMKTAIVLLLKTFEFQIVAKTPIPVVFDPMSIVMIAEGGMWLKAVERSL